MQITPDKLISSWNKWCDQDRDSFQLITIENKYFIYKGIGYESCIYQKNKCHDYTVCDFICQCCITNDWNIDDLIDAQDDVLKYKTLSEKEFKESVNKMQFEIRFWDKPILKRLPKEKIRDVVSIYEWWDSSDYVIEYENKWVYLSLSINY